MSELGDGKGSASTQGSCAMLMDHAQFTEGRIRSYELD